MCLKCELDLNIKRENRYRCPICNNELFEIKFSDKDKEKSIKEYTEKIDENKINEILDNEDIIKEKILKKGKGRAQEYVEAFFKLIKDPKVLMKNKILPAAALLYLFTPIDIVPDVMVGVGLLDDGAILMSVFKLMADVLSEYIDGDEIKKTIDNVKENIREFRNQDRVILYIC